MQFGDNPFELPTNTDLEKVLKKNLDHTNPLEMKEFTNDGKKRLFPFWTPVKDPEVNAQDYTQYLDSKAKAMNINSKKDKVGMVQPKDDTKSYESSSLLDQITKLINNQNNAKTFDNSGVVNPHSEKMDSSKTNKQAVDNQVGEADLKVEKAGNAKVGSGEKGNMGVVKPHDEMGKQNVPDMENNSEKAKGGNVGAVKPKTDNLAKPTDINFDKYKTDQIKGASFKK